MARLLSSGQRILALCTLVSVGTAFAQDSELPNVTATSQVSEFQRIPFRDLPGVYSDARSPAQGVVSFQRNTTSGRGLVLDIEIRASEKPACLYAVPQVTT
jgi:hypothetical protein